MHIASRLCRITRCLLFNFNIAGKMYRLQIVSVIFLALACKGETKLASAAAAPSSTSGQSAQAAGNQLSNTAGDLAGPTSTTQGSNASYAVNTTLPGTTNPNRIPNEM